MQRRLCKIFLDGDCDEFIYSILILLVESCSVDFGVVLVFPNDFKRLNEIFRLESWTQR